MKLDELKAWPGSRRRRKRVGRGPASGHGKTSTKGHKGHKARSGGGKAGGFEGGQMPLYRRLPKRGFLPHGGKTEYAVVNLKSLGAFPPQAVVDPDSLAGARLIKRSQRDLVKILGTGEVPHALTVRVHAISASARAKVVDRGGSVELLAVQAATP
jgi:large subunit ribosomal protein L15